MSVIYCFRCGRHEDSDFRDSGEAYNSKGELEMVCERCVEEIGLAEDEGEKDERGYTLAERDADYDESMDGDHESALESVYGPMDEGQYDNEY